MLDGKQIGKTPLPRLGVIPRLQLGPHKLRVEAKGYAPFEDEVQVRFQKVSQVIVRLLPSTEVIGTGRTVTVERQPFYSKTWFIVGVGVAAVLLGATIGYAAGQVDCTKTFADGTTGSC
jgi:hypothetical protein